MKRISPGELPEVTATIQALDNQWTPQRILHKMMENRQGLSDVKEDRDRFVRGEFIRGLINLQSVVINRASLINTDVITTMLIKESDERRHFINFINNGTIIPFLYNERNLYFEDFKFDAAARNKLIWQELCDDITSASAVRLDWDDNTNNELIKIRLARAFHERVVNLASKNHGALLDAFGAPTEARPELRKRLGALANHLTSHYAETENYTTRNIVYERYISADGEGVDLGRYDPDKPFAAIIKQCVDLVYNSNLPDALGRYPLTPVGSPSRAILQEDIAAAAGPAMSAEAIVQQLRGAAFRLSQDELTLASYADLRLGEAAELRRHDAWTQYITAMKGILAQPDTFGDPQGLESVYTHYIRLAAAAAGMVRERRIESAAARWVPMVKYVIEAAGSAIVDEIIDAIGGSPIFNVAAAPIINHLAERATPVVVRMVIGGVDRMRGGPEQDDFDTSVVIWQGRMENAKTQFLEIAEKLRKDERAGDIGGGGGRQDAPGLDEKG